MRDRGIRYWLPTYIAEAAQRGRMRKVRRQQLTHVLVLVCDHFEPMHGATHAGQPASRIEAWRTGYTKLQQECLRKFGTRPLHSWFYPPHHGLEFLPALANLVTDGLGEVELHYHHKDDNAGTLRSNLRRVLAEYREFGLLLSQGKPPVETFGFIHGDWALDNSAGGRFCGVNGELSLLKELGCWGDLTMPSVNACQTRRIN